jgi:hypothetical protein
MNGSYSGGGLYRTEEEEHEFGVIDDEVCVSFPRCRIQY